MKLKLLLFSAVIVLASFQQKKDEPLTHKTINTETDKIFDKLVKIRRNFHENPELAGKEKQTQEFIKQYLLDLGLKVEPDVYGHGIVGILEGNKKGKKIAWRSDMDALPNNFPDKVDFKSKIDAVQHGCGHDVHMAIGLGIAEILSKNKKLLNGTVYFIFQPEEETFVGAKAMIEGGLFTRIKPDEIYALHVSALPVGKIMARPNEMFAYQKRVRIKLKNELSNEEAKELSQKIYRKLFRTRENTKPWDIQFLADPNLGLSNPNTIFQDYLFMDKDFRIRTKENELLLEAYVYETNKSNQQNIIPEIEQVIKETKYKDLLVSIDYIQNNPTIQNNEKLTDQAINTISKVYGKQSVLPDYGQIPYFNDDFAYFQQKVPGVYFLLGGSNLEKGIIAMNHAPNFMVDEECLRIGVKSFSSLIAERLKP